MFYALDKDGQRINAFDANREEKYICPICKQRVILKRGSINIDHFAHESNTCEDHWNYDMSEWHKRMQNYFPKECQEVVVTYMEQKHRADVLVGDIVIEFQYSPITSTEFEDRNQFFKNAGYRLAWVFNLSQVQCHMEQSPEKENLWSWKHPMRIFANVDHLGENNKKFALWFYLWGEVFENIGYEYIERVIWAIKESDQYSMRKFMTSEYPIEIGGKTEIDPELFFNAKEYHFQQEKEYFQEALSDLKKEFSYTVKYGGAVRGKPKHTYMCPRKNGEFGIKMWGEKGCFYCKYCYMVTEKKNGDRKMYESYCCYPTQVRELSEDHQRIGYECTQVDIFEL